MQNQMTETKIREVFVDIQGVYKFN